MAGWFSCLQKKKKRYSAFRKPTSSEPLSLLINYITETYRLKVDLNIANTAFRRLSNIHGENGLLPYQVGPMHVGSSDILFDTWLSSGNVSKCNKPDCNSNSALGFLNPNRYPLHTTTHIWSGLRIRRIWTPSKIFGGLSKDAPMRTASNFHPRMNLWSNIIGVWIHNPWINSEFNFYGQSAAWSHEEKWELFQQITLLFYCAIRPNLL